MKSSQVNRISQVEVGSREGDARSRLAAASRDGTRQSGEGCLAARGAG